MADKKNPGLKRRKPDKPKSEVKLKRKIKEVKIPGRAGGNYKFTGGPKGIKEEYIIDALWRAAGFRNAAAKALGFTTKALDQRIRRSQNLQDALNEIFEVKLDNAEMKLSEAIDSGASWAICFFLKCRGKKRGYVEKEYINQYGSIEEKARQIKNALNEIEETIG